MTVWLEQVFLLGWDGLPLEWGPRLITVWVGGPFAGTGSRGGRGEVAVWLFINTSAV